MALVHDAAEAKTGDVPLPNKTPRMTEVLDDFWSNPRNFDDRGMAAE